MTHVQIYNLSDLWSYFTCLGLSVEGYRVDLRPSKESPIRRLMATISSYVITRIVGADYADNILLIAKKPH